jgi:hypothetical protein
MEVVMLTRTVLDEFSQVSSVFTMCRDKIDSFSDEEFWNSLKMGLKIGGPPPKSSIYHYVSY